MSHKNYERTSDVDTGEDSPEKEEEDGPPGDREDPSATEISSSEAMILASEIAVLMEKIYRRGTSVGCDQG